MSTGVFEIRYKVRGFDCGYGASFRPMTIANFFQEAAGGHADILGIGMEAMFAAGRTWMLSRIDIAMEALPEEGDDVLVRTWPAGTDRIFALRYIEMLGAGGRRLGGALYSYLIVDIEKRRPIRPEKILGPAMKTDIPPPYPDLSPGALTAPEFDEARRGGWTAAFAIQAGPRHIDHNGHVNNAHFIDWLCDAIPSNERGRGRVARIKADFAAEVKLGENIEVFRAEGREPGEKYSILARSGEVVARALTRWS